MSNNKMMIAGGVAAAALTTAALPFVIGGTKLLYAGLGIGALTGLTVAQLTCGIRAIESNVTKALVTLCASITPALFLSGAAITLGNKFLSSTAPRALVGAELFGVGAASTLALPAAVKALFEVAVAAMGGGKAEAEVTARGKGE